ncbi:MAG: Zn-dependent hydrolase [Longimicrobiales bacterium]
MDRRGFSRSLLAALGLSALGEIPGAAGASLRAGAPLRDVPPSSVPPPGVADASEQARDPYGLRIDGPRLNGWLAEFSRFGRRSDGGVDRVAFSDANLEGRAWVLALMEEMGLRVRIDVAGNILGRREGSDPDLPPLWVGSHLDSVPAGGNYDGPLGTLGALEAVRTLQEAGVRTRHPLEVVVFVNEEGGKTGSRVMAGEVAPRELQLETASGYTIGEGIRRLGGDPDRLEEGRVAPGTVAGFLEIHVEQGAVLEEEGARIGVVEGIVGIRRWNATVQGAANHAGTTPMNRRRDAMLGAAGLVEAVNRVVTSMPGSQVGTVGRIQAHPGAPNVIPGEVTLSIEIRALEMSRIQEVFEGIQAESEDIARRNGTPIALEEFYLSRAAPSDERFRTWVEESAEALELTALRMPSGAGHDAQSVAQFAPMGMIFIPSVGGLSHHPDEYSRPEDVEAGVNVLLHSLMRADRGLQS